MNETQKKVLLKVAYETVKAVLSGDKVASVESDDDGLNANCGCFVTLKNHGRLRGCIGQFTSDSPLIELVSAMAISSLQGDPRFFNDMITIDEMQDIDVEISVLSPLKLIKDPLSLRLGVDGIYIKNRGLSGCFLPQVATETGWSKEEFLSNCCAHKAGLSTDAWKKPETEVYIFTADVFGATFKEISLWPKLNCQ